MWQVFAFVSALFSASAAILEKKALFKMDALSFSLVLSIITFVFTLPFFMAVDFSTVRLDAVGVLYIKSILGAGAFLLVMFGIKNNELSNSLPLLVLTPAVVAVAAYFLLGEHIGPYETGGMILLLVGTYFLQLDKKGNWKSPFLFVKRNKAQWYILGAILLFSITTILDKTILKNFKLQPEAFLPIQQLFFSINFLIMYFLRKKSKEEIYSEVKRNLWIIVLIGLCAVIYRYAHILALKAGSVALVLSIKRTSVFFATVIGGTLFKEQNVFRRSVAVVIMIAGAVVLIVS
jgi:uncharacterized membrane protein